MNNAYSVKSASGESEVTEFGRGRKVAIFRNVVSVSNHFHMILITSGQPTDPQYFVAAVDEFYAFLRSSCKNNRETSNGTKYVFDTADNARKAYEMLVRIGNM